MAQNPFYHRGPIRESKHFCGRQAETEQLANLLRVSQSVSVVGPRRIGKTSLLYHLHAPDVRAAYGLQAPGFSFASVDAEGLAQAPVATVYAAFLDALQDALREAPATPAAEAPTRPADYHALDGALKACGRQGTRVAFFIDEFEALAGNPNLDPSFFSGLRGLATRHAVSYIVASQRPLIALVYADHSVLSSPFFNIFATVPLGLFDGATARELVQDCLATSEAELPPPALQAIADLAGPHPFFVQVAAYHAWEVARSEPAWDERAGKRLAETFYQEARPHYLYHWRNLDDAQQYALANLAVTQHDSASREVLRRLQEECLILPINGGYHYLSPALRRFVRCQRVPGLLQSEPFVIDLRGRVATAADEPLPLTKTQFAILSYLAERSGRVVTSRELEESVWRDEYVEDPERLKAAIKHLRRALGPWASCVVNERGVGYVLRGMVECQE